jgi:hypothetical protein
MYLDNPSGRTSEVHEVISILTPHLSEDALPKAIAY